MSVEPFPDVDEDQIDAAGKAFHSSVSKLTSAGSKLSAAAATTTWQADAARPAWDSAITARQGDVAGASEVLGYVGDVLRSTAGAVREAHHQWAAAMAYLMYVFEYPDPPADPSDQQQYQAYEKMGNDAVSDANYALALCASQLIKVTNGVNFPSVPSDAPGSAVASSSQGFTIFPLAPAFGAPAGAIFANGIPVQFTKGVNFESSVLRDLGIGQSSKDFFRPDSSGNYNLPRTKSGSLYRGTFPDSTEADELEIKSGTTEITESPQISVQLWVAKQLGIPYQMIVSKDTPVDPDLLAKVTATGGSVYSKVPDSDLYYDHGTGQYVKLQGGAGASGKSLESTPVNQADIDKIPAETRSQIESKAPYVAKPPASTDDGLPGSSEPYVTQQQYDQEWGEVPDAPTGGGGFPFGDDGDGDDFPIDPEDIFP